MAQQICKKNGTKTQSKGETTMANSQLNTNDASPRTGASLRSVLMWIRIRAVIIEDEPLAAQYLAVLLDDTCQVEVVGSATESEAGLRLFAELRPDLAL